MKNRRIIVVGGGAAGFFAAIKCAETDPHSEVIVMEKGPRFLQKVSISGGGRCNVTHACFDGRELARRYPRGGRELIGAFQRFQARDTVAWFESRGVQLKEEPDGRMFPVTDSSQTIVDCLVRNAQSAGVTLLLNSTVEGARRRTDGGFELRLGSGDMLCCDRLMLASGGCRSTSAGELPQSLGHALEAPVPSLFTFHIDTGWLHALAGVCAGRHSAGNNKKGWPGNCCPPGFLSAENPLTAMSLSPAAGCVWWMLILKPWKAAFVPDSILPASCWISTVSLAVLIFRRLGPRAGWPVGQWAPGPARRIAPQFKLSCGSNNPPRHIFIWSRLRGPLLNHPPQANNLVTALAFTSSRGCFK